MFRTWRMKLATLLVCTTTWKTVPRVHHSEAVKRPPGLCSSLLPDYIERIVGVPGDPARIWTHQGEPCVSVDFIKPADDLEGLDLVVEDPPVLEGEHVQLLELGLVGVALET